MIPIFCSRYRQNLNLLLLQLFYSSNVVLQTWTKISDISANEKKKLKLTVAPMPLAMHGFVE